VKEMKWWEKLMWKNIPKRWRIILRIIALLLGFLTAFLLEKL